MGGKRNVFLSVSLVIAGVFFALLTSEVLVRLFNLAPAVGVVQIGRYRLSTDPRIGYEPEPNLNYQGQDLSFYDWRGQTNSLGYRDYQHLVEKEQGVYRIVVLGDSIGQGFYIANYKDTFVPTLEKALRDSGKNVEILNFSVSGYNTTQEVETLKNKGLVYKPDLVIVAYCLNDTEQADGGILKSLLLRKGNSAFLPANGLLLRSYLYRAIRYRLFPEKNNYGALSQNTVGEALGDLSSLAQSNNFKVLVDVFPRLDNLKNYQYGADHQYVEKLAVQNRFQYIDLLSTFKFCQESFGDPISYDVFHPTKTGDTCAAGATASYISQNFLN